MILTGKCKEDFSYKYNMSNFNEYSEVLQNALIIEFFDSVGIYINTIRNIDDTIYCRILMLNKAFYGKSRQEAITKAIKKANDIYNKPKSSVEEYF